MQKLFCLFLICLSLFAQNINKIEEVYIEKVVNENYIKGLETRDFSLITDICIPETKLMSVRNTGELNVTTLDKWSKRFDPKKPPFEKLESCILKIDQTRNAAQVKIRFLINEKTEVVDYLNMLKINNEWKVVNIIDS